MFETLVANVLNKVLGDYVDNLETKQLNIGIWSGDVVLRNLRLKREALDKFELPIDVVEGFLGTLILNIPWSNLKNQPVRVQIRDLFILAAPRAETEYDEELEKQREYRRKMHSLETAEMFHTKSSTVSGLQDESTTKEQQSFYTQLVTKIIDNLQVSIENIHVRYEDRQSNPGHMMAAGLTLAKLSLASTDENWKETFIDAPTSTIRKLLSLDSASIYFNSDSHGILTMGDASGGLQESQAVIDNFTRMVRVVPSEKEVQYILRPVSGTGRLLLNKKDVPKGTAKTQATLLFEEIAFLLDRSQYQSVLMCVNHYHYSLKQLRVCKNRPPKDHTPKTHPREWWDFAGKTILSRIHDRNRRWSWDYLKERRDDREKYIDLYHKVRQGTILREDEEFKGLEYKLPLRDLRFYRALAQRRVRKEKETERREKDEKDEDSGDEDGGNSEVPWSKEDINKLYDTIGYEEGAGDTLSEMGLSEEEAGSILDLSVGIQLQRGSLTLLSPDASSSSLRGKELLTIALHGLGANAEKWLDQRVKASLSLRGFSIRDGSTPGTLHPYLAQVNPDDDEGGGSSGVSSSSSLPYPGSSPSKDTSEGQLSSPEENQEEVDRPDRRVELRMRNVDIVWNGQAISALEAFFRPPEMAVESLQALIDAAGDTLEGLREQTRLGLQYALEEHKQTAVHIDLAAPTLIIPESCTEPDCLVAVVDCGRVGVRSVQLVRKKERERLVKGMSAGEGQVPGDDDALGQLASLVYDRYQVDLSRVQVLLGRGVSQCLSASRTGETDVRHLLDPVGISCAIDVSILPKTRHIPAIKVTGRLPALSLHMSDQKWKGMMRLVDVILKAFGDHDERGEGGEDVEGGLHEAPGGLESSHGKGPQDKRRMSKEVDFSIWGKRNLLDAPDHDVEDEDGHLIKVSSRVRLLEQQTLSVHLIVGRLGITLSSAIGVGPLGSILEERRLAELFLEDCQAQMLIRPMDMRVSLRLHRWSMREKDMPLRDRDGKRPLSFESAEATPDQDGSLLTIRYERMDVTSPLFRPGISAEQRVHVGVGVVVIRVSHRSILPLFDFILHTFTPDPVQKKESKEEYQRSSSPSSSNPKKLGEGSIGIKARLERLRLDFEGETADEVFASAIVESASFNLSLPGGDDEGMRMETTLGRLGLERGGDQEIIGGISEWEEEEGGVKKEAVRVVYATSLSLLKEGEGDGRGYSALAKVRTGSLHLRVIETNVDAWLKFSSRFRRMEAFLVRAREAAAEGAAQMMALPQHSRSEMDVIVQSPVVEIPLQDGETTLVARLGQLSLENELVEGGRGDKVSLRVRQTHLASQVKVRTVGHENQRMSKVDERRILEGVDILVDLYRLVGEDQAVALNSPAPVPGMRIQGWMSAVEANMTAKQYRMLLETVGLAGRLATQMGNDGTEEVAGMQEQMIGDQSTPVPPNLDKAPKEEPKEETGSSVSGLSSGLDVVFTLERVKLELLLTETAMASTPSSSSLAILSLSHPTVAKYRTGEDTEGKKTFDASLVLHRLELHDARNEISTDKQLQGGSRVTAFPEIIPEGDHDSPQCLVDVHGEPSGRVVAQVTVDSPKIILNLGFLLALKEFFTPLDIAAGSPSIEPSSSSSQGEEGKVMQERATREGEEDSEAMVFHFRVNVVDAQAIVLAHPEDPATEAIVLSTRQVLLSQQGILAATIEGLGVSVCRMDHQEETTLHFVDPLDLSITVDGRRESGSNQDRMSIGVEVRQVTLRLSLRDMLLITEIASEAAMVLGKGGTDQARDKGEDVTKTIILDQEAKSSSQARENRVGGRVVKAEVMPHEELTVRLDGLEWVLIGDLTDLPLVDVRLGPAAIRIRDWSSEVSVETLGALRLWASYFNGRNSHWEPLVEPWEVGARVGRDREGVTRVNVRSRQRLEVSITHALLEHIVHASLAISSATEEQEGEGTMAAMTKGLAPRGSYAPYRLRNHTGHPMHVWSEGGDNVESVITRLDVGEEIPWRFEDWRKLRDRVTVGETSNSQVSSRRNLLGMQLEGGGDADVLWESIKEIPVDRENVGVYRLRPDVRGVGHRVVVEVALREGVKIITFRSSLVLRNRTLIPLEVLMESDHGKRATSPVARIDPGEEWAVPIAAAYLDALRIRPEGVGYHWSTEVLYWKDAVRSGSSTKRRSSSSASLRTPPFRFRVGAIFDSRSMIASKYPDMYMDIYPPLEIENLLPYDIKCRIVDRTTRQEYSNHMLKGSSSPLHILQTGHLLLMSIEISGSVFGPSDFAIIDGSRSSGGNAEDDDVDLDTHLVLRDSNGLKLYIQMQRIDIPNSGMAYKLLLYSPYIMLNRTGLDLQYRAKSFLQSARLAAGQTATANGPLPRSPSNSQTSFSSSSSNPTSPAPFLFSYGPNTSETRNRAAVRVKGSGWSKPMSFEAVGSAFEVQLPREGTDGGEVRLAVDIKEGEGKFCMTKVVTLRPRFILINRLKRKDGGTGEEGIPLCFRQPGANAELRLESGMQRPVHWLRTDEGEQQLVLRHAALRQPWTSPFRLTSVGRTHVKEPEMDEELMLLEITVRLEGATLLVSIRDAGDSWPFRIENDTDIPLVFYQPVAASDESSSVSRGRRYTLPPKATTPYAWDYPALPDRRLIINMNGKEREVILQEIGPLVPLKIPNVVDGRPYRVVEMDVRAEGMMQVLRLAPYRPGQSIVSGAPSQSASSSSQDGFELEGVDLSLQWSVEVELAGVGISLMNRRQREILYATLRGIEVRMADAAAQQSLSVVVRWIQVDNQMYDALFPIVFYPTVINASKATAQSHPALHGAVVRSRDTAHGVQYYKYCSLLMQEMSLELDEDFLMALLDISKFDDIRPKTSRDDPPSRDEDERAKEEADEGNQLYFELLHIQPIKVNLSFLRTERYTMEAVDMDGEGGSLFAGSNPINFILNILTMTVGNMNDAPIRLNALLLENLRSSPAQLTERFTQHYQQELIYQVHLVVGSADILGNPVGLFNNLTSGVADIFYEPYQGFIMSDRPQDLGIGLMKGTASFFKKTVFGFTDSFSKFTGSVGKGLSVVTMDKAFQNRRRISRARNRPKHALTGVAQGANSLASGVFSGVTGVVTQPLLGAESEGVSGFFKGVGKGLIGAVAKPMVGVVDMASTVTEGIRNTTTVFDDNAIDRARLPRQVSREGILKSYNERESLGQRWMAEAGEGKYRRDFYVAHIVIPSEEQETVILTNLHIMCISIKRLRVVWAHDVANVQTVRVDGSGLSLVLRDNVPGPFIPVPTASLTWFYRAIEEVMLEVHAEKRLLEE
ncbi:MAG: hypothetical protein DHS80DRAFT_13996 [Piptocephalis tieghemiana]|nr:MAG: hypothetical protein DHS80DRAFT_13996 [Piptocephalis tieghemiana]